MGRRVLPLVGALLVLGIGGTLLRSWIIGYPLFPRITERTWAARLVARWEPGRAPVSVLLPRNAHDVEVTDERFAAGPLETVVAAGAAGNRQVVWIGEGARTAAYEAEINVSRARRAAGEGDLEDPDPWLSVGMFPAPVVAAALRVAAEPGPGDRAGRCFDLISGRAAPGRFEAEVQVLRVAFPTLAQGLVACWRAAGLPARMVQVVPLKPGLYRRAEVLAEVFGPSGWTLADPERRRFPESGRRFLVWARVSRPLAVAHDGSAVAWELELQARPLRLWQQFFRRTADRASWLARWSLYTLPPEIQEVFRVLLLVPLGALAVSLLRNVVGFATFGTFMPILIAIAFRQTELLYGLGLFGLVVAAGYAARLGIDRYKLLLVPRLAAILTFVIGCLAVLALVGHHLGLRNVIVVGLLPMVILTMTIERFYVVAEESGARAALRMAAGTGAVAALTYGIISWEYLQLLFFTYPELLFVIGAGQIALGRYVGFRLAELWRFRRLAGTL